MLVLGPNLLAFPPNRSVGLSIVRRSASCYIVIYFVALGITIGSLFYLFSGFLGSLLVAICPAVAILCWMQYVYQSHVHTSQILVIFSETMFYTFLWLLLGPFWLAIPIYPWTANQVPCHRAPGPSSSWCIGGYAFSAYVTAGVVEETIKYFAVRRMLYSSLVNDPRALFVYGVASGAGFAALENVLYVMSAGSQGVPISILRAITAVPMHCTLGLMAGVILGYRRFLKMPGLRFYVILLPAVFVHGSYDFVLFTASGLSAEGSGLGASLLSVSSYFFLLLGIFGTRYGYLYLQQKILSQPSVHVNNFTPTCSQLCCCLGSAPYCCGSAPSQMPDNDVTVDGSRYVALPMETNSDWAELPKTNSNPFQTATPPDCYEKIKIFFFSISGIALLRLLLILVCWLLMALFATLGNIFCRKLWTYPMRCVARLILFFAGFYWIAVDDRRRKPFSANIIVCNHVSIFDGLHIFYKTGCSVVGKKEVFDIPVFGQILKAMDGIPVVRETEEGRSKAKKDISDRAADLSAAPLLIFAQGTTANQTTLTSFAQGAFLCGLPVQPVCMRFPYLHWDLFLDDSQFNNLWRTLCQFVNFGSYTYLEEYRPSEEILI